MALPKLADWKAPWELKDEEFDEESARKYIYDLTSDKEKLQARVDTSKTEATALEAKVAEAKKELEAAQAKGDNADVVKDLQEKLAKAEDRAEKAETQNLRLTVAVDKGIPASQADRLRGKTKEEIEADADDFLQSFGVNGEKTGDDEDDDDEDEDGVPSRTPKRLTNPTDRGTGDSDLIDIDKALASIPRL